MTNSKSDVHLPQNIASKLSAESRRIAKKIDELNYIYALYGMMDGLSISYSMVKYLFDLLPSKDNRSSSEMMHNWLVTPEGVAIAAVESITLIAFSLLANIYADNDKTAFKRYIAIAWPYCRDSMKGLKNAYKGVRSTLLALTSITGSDLNYMIAPVGIALGALSVVNRFYMRKYVKEPRLAMTKVNAKLLLDIKKASFAGLDKEACADFRARKKSHSAELNRRALLGASYGGVVDGLYLYMGALGLAALTSQAFMVMTICSVIFSLTCVITRVYEEYDFQRRFHGTQVKIELALCGKELEGLLAILQRLSDPLKLMHLDNKALDALSTNLKSLLKPDSPILSELEGLSTALSKPSLETSCPVENADSLQKEAGLLESPCLVSLETTIEKIRASYIKQLQCAYMEALVLKKEAFDAERNKLHLLVNLSRSLAVFAGLRNGLAAFSAITSLMFAVATIDAIFLVAVSPQFVQICIGIGMVALVVFLVHSLMSHSAHRQKDSLSEASLLNVKLFDLLESVKSSQKQVHDLSPDEVKEAITGGMVVDPSPQFFIQEWFEVFRSLGSGFYKGPKLAEFVENMGEGLGVCSGSGAADSPLMFKVSVVSAFAQALTFSLRALARGFGRDAPDVVQIKKIPEPPSQLVEARPSTPVIEPEKRPSRFGFFSQALAYVIPPQQVCSAYTTP